MHVTSAEMLGTRAQETSFFEVSERRLSFLTTRHSVATTILSSSSWKWLADRHMFWDWYKATNSVQER